MDFTAEYNKLLILYEGFETLTDEAYKAMKTAELNDATPQEQMDILYDKCDKMLDAKCNIANALKSIRKMQEMKAALAQMELQAQELTNRAIRSAAVCLKW